jgi:CheY-like chemotaxis protein
MATILVVDDYEEFRIILTRFLNGEGHFVIALESGPRALEYLGQHTVDLAILDYIMPEMDGVTLLERMKSDWPELPLILFTGYADSRATHVAAIREVTCLCKPIKGDKLT